MNANENSSADSTVTQLDVFEAATDIICAALKGGFPVSVTALPDFITTVHDAVSKQANVGNEPAQPAAPEPHMPIKKTITPDWLISLEDGKRYKSLKRHLTGRGLTTDEYRAKWGLPNDYPMVAPNYSKQRSELAKALGLGKQSPAQRVAEVKAIVRRAAKKAA